MIKVTFRNIEPSDALHDHAIERLDKAEKYLYRDYSGQVILSTERFWQVAEIRLIAEGRTLVGSARTEDMYSAIDGAMDKVEEQLRRLKDRTHVPSKDTGEFRLEKAAAEEVAEEVGEEEAP